ncbi:MAG: VWA domain-containing protein [Burkholderiaceae bacterium]
MNHLLRRLALAASLGLALWLAACSKDPADGTTGAAANTFTILAGSELKDLEPLLPALEKATGLKLQLQYTGTLEAVERLVAGDKADAAWFASNRYALLTPGAKEKILTSERTMITPVVLGLKQSKAQSLGWLDAAGNSKPGISWKDIASAAEKGQFTFGMTSPSASNTGFAGLMGVAAALAGKGDALEVADIKAAQLSAFFKAQTLTAGSSGWLADAFVKEQTRIDGMINYGSVIHALNASGKLTEPLALIYPQDGIVTADYPLMLLNASKRADYDKLLAYVRSPAFQQPMSQQTFRKPIAADVPSDPKLYPATLIELPFPAKLAVVDAILDAFDNSLRRPADSTFVLDISGSMKGERMTQMKAALQGLTGLDSSLSGRFARLRERERISMIAFDDTPRRASQFRLDKARREATENEVRAYIEQLEPYGGTAIFTAAQDAYLQAAKRRAAEKPGGKSADSGYYYSVLLLTDGENNRGWTSAQFENWYQNLPESDRGIKIFAVQFGEAKADQLEVLARLTGGRVFNATKTPLAQVFKEIRGYQ